MQWFEVREAYPDEWLVIEALQAITTPNSLRQIKEISVVERCEDGKIAMQRYRQLHQQFPEREMYFIHTSRKELDIREIQWIGIRRGNATPAQR